MSNATSCAGAVEPRAQEGFPRCRTFAKAVGGPRVDPKLGARCRATSMADSRAHQASADVQVQLQDRLQALLEEARIKLSILVCDLPGASARRVLEDWACTPRCEAAISAARVSKNTKQKKNLKSELHGEIPPRISRVERCAQLLSDLEHCSLSESRPETTSHFHSGFQLFGF